MDYNFHTHTYRCGHAEGTDEEYVQNAIRCGIKHMGFSDHMPVKFPDDDNGFEVYHTKVKEYCKSIGLLKDKYKNKIDIKIGFEVEYSPKHFASVREAAKEHGIEYLICGQHFIETEHSGYVYSIFENNRTEDLQNYVSTVISAMEEGAYTYIAHPDMFNFVGDCEIYDREMRKICLSSARLNIPLELNFLGIRGKRNYPNDSFWRLAGEENSPVVFGIDAHSPSSSYDEASLKIAMELADKYSLNIVNPKLKAI
ncbi:MAG: histidinol-phosphatase [Clostridia bacterium]|nr:histidinol-phosphatase [Clostridia bacterium]